MLKKTDPPMTDQQLIERTVNGQAEAFEQLVQRYQGQLFNGILRMVSSHADAEDIVQEALVQAYLKLPLFRQDSAFYTWLYRIAVNNVYTHSRRQQRRVFPSRARPVSEEELPDPRGTPDDELERREQAGQIEKAMAALGEEHRIILVLRGVEGFDYATIGRILDLSPGTVRSRLHRARLQLRGHLLRTFYCCT
jgi:RNA polymerase sigma-70 factor, ECF subfamily